MKQAFYTLSILLFSFLTGSAQQSYCTTDLYTDASTCKVTTQNGVTFSSLGIRDFILMGHGGSKIVDTGTGCGTSNASQLNQLGYSDRTSITPVELRRDSTYTITVKQEEGYDSAGIKKNYSWFATWVAIDFNDNFAFDTTATAGEFVIVRDTFFISNFYEKLVQNPSSILGFPTP